MVLKALMEIKGINNLELSRMTGLSVYEISRLRVNTRQGKISTIRKIAKALDVPPRILTLRIKEGETNDKVQN